MTAQKDLIIGAVILGGIALFMLKKPLQDTAQGVADTATSILEPIQTIGGGVNEGLDKFFDYARQGFKTDAMIQQEQADAYVKRENEFVERAGSFIVEGEKLGLSRSQIGYQFNLNPKNSLALSGAGYNTPINPSIFGRQGQLLTIIPPAESAKTTVATKKATVKSSGSSSLKSLIGNNQALISPIPTQKQSYLPSVTILKQSLAKTTAGTALLNALRG